MLYLAEVLKQSSKFGLGGGRTELKLLACQRGENNWSAVPSDEVIPADDANNFKDGTLVLVDLNASKQVQRIQEAARQLVGILQDFSRLQEKFKTQQEEIEQWKESLTYQSQELNRREMEMEARREQMEQLEEEFERLEQQRREIESSREESSRLQAEVEQARREMEQTQEQVRLQRQQLEEQQANLISSPGVSEDQKRELETLLKQLSNQMSLQSLQDQLSVSCERVSAGQGLLASHWQQLDGKQAEAQRLQDEVEQVRQTIESQWQEWYQAQDLLSQQQGELKAQQSLLQAKLDYTQILQTQIQARQSMVEQLKQLATLYDEPSTVSVKVDVQALEAMPLEQLQAEVDKLQQDWDRGLRLVKDQEEELKSKLEEIDEITKKLKSAGEGERSSLQTDLADEQDAYQMLNETLVGQRRTLKEREEHLNQYQAVLLRRQGLPPKSVSGRVDFKSLIAELESQQQQQQQELQSVEADIQQIRSKVSQAEELVNRQGNEQQQKRQQLETQEKNWLEQQQMIAQLRGRVNVYQEMLQPVQEGWDAVRGTLGQATNELNQLQQAIEAQVQAITQLQQVVSSLSS